MKRIFYIASLFGLLTTSCSDFFEVESDHVIFDNQEHLVNATDTLYSMVGILNKLQAIGDRTILLGELRGDLTDITENTSSDLREIAMFNVSDDNMYNSPRDYYAIINNCNYYLKHADPEVKNNRNEPLFLHEYAAVKAVRAWTYLQLVTTYGKVPLVTEPILTKEEAERDYPVMDIEGICNYFLNEDNLEEYAECPYPDYSLIKGLPSSIFFIPMKIVLGDLNLWTGNYLKSAQWYYDYINTRNGTNSYYAGGYNFIYWQNSTWTGIYSSWHTQFTTETDGEQTEIITVIPGDSVPSEGYYSQLRNIFNSTSENNYVASATPSQAIKDLSAAQTYCHYQDGSYLNAPSNLEGSLAGDLRLYNAFYTTSTTNYGEQIEYQYFRKYQTRNIHIYRRTLLYLRMAEALNRAGYPRFAFSILSTGVNNRVINRDVIPYYKADSLLLTTFDFPNAYYMVYDPEEDTTGNTRGIHSRGSGYTPKNEDYQMPYNEEITDSLEQIAWQQIQVEDLIMQEEALEFAFEGYRFYDLMRVALRRNDPSYLAERIYARRGVKNEAAMRSEIKADLLDIKNWFLHWNGQIGY